MLSRIWNGRNIRQREDGYICLTDMAIANGKLIADWYRLKSTEEYLQELEGSMGIPIDQFVQINESAGANESRGTWGHRRVAVRVAQWCNVRFAIQVDIWVEELLLTGKVELQPQPKIEPLKREHQLEALKMLFTINERSPDDRTTVTLKAHLTNLIESSQQSELTPQLLSVTEICELHGINIPKGKDSVIGRKAAREWRENHNGTEPQICAKHVGTGHRTADIKVYPTDFFERIIAIAEEYLG